MYLALLADHPAAVPVVARWYFDEWGHKTPTNSIEREITLTRSYLNRDCIPLMVIAVESGQVIGGAQLKYHEMDIYPDKAHWLGGVYVNASYRGKGVAEAIILRLLDYARLFGVEQLFLQTVRVDGGLYRRMGWEPIEIVNYQGENVLVMELDIRSTSTGK